MPNFKVGDRVRCNPKHNHWPAYLRSDIGTVISTSGGGIYEVDWLRSGRYTGQYTDWGLVAAPITEANRLGNFPAKGSDPEE